jgi:presenilin-like A22 family membrane protease
VAAFAFFAIAYEQTRTVARERWYLAVLPPILFVLLYLVYNGTILWFPYLLNVYALMFAVLITLYLGSMFSWRNVLIFAGLLTVIDIILVLVTGFMVTAAKTVSGLGLPVLVSLPTVPLIITEEGMQYMSLGLGDFFFSGILATQTYKRFGKKTAVLSVVTMCLSFAIFEAFLLSTNFGAFPGTLMIICGWLPIVAWKLLAEKRIKKLK